MMLFSHRMKIENLFFKWCEENGIAKEPNSLVAFMQGKHWLNTEKIIEDLKEMEK